MSVLHVVISSVSLKAESADYESSAYAPPNWHMYICEMRAL